MGRNSAAIDRLCLSCQVVQPNMDLLRERLCMSTLFVSGGSPACFLGCTCISSYSEIAARLEFVFHSCFSQMDSSFCLPGLLCDVKQKMGSIRQGYCKMPSPGLWRDSHWSVGQRGLMNKGYF